MHHHYTQSSSKESKAKIQIINKVSIGKVRPLRNGKYIPPKVACCKFESGNQPLQKKIGGKIAFQSPLLEATEVGALGIGYELINKVSKGGKWSYEHFQNK